MSIKISKISSFSFSFKLNEEKKMFKILIWRWGLQENSCWRGGLIVNRVIGNISMKKEGLDKEGLEKQSGGSCDPQRNYGGFW